MVRRRWELDPELAPVARERLRRVLEGDGWAGERPVETSPRRGRPPEAEEDDLLDGPVGLDDLAPPPRRFTRWHLGVVAGLVVLGLVWGGWSLLRARPVAVAAPTGVQTSSVPVGSAAAAPSGTASPESSASPSVRLVVHVLGAVRRPGLVRLPEHARVQDAIDAAGGLTGAADPGELNLAQPLADGEQVLIGRKGHAEGEVRSGDGGSTGGGDPGSGSTSTSATVDLNRATAAQLEELPGVGPVTAQKILAWRQQHGRFSRPEELQEVDGIGPKTYAQIAPHVRV